MPRVKVVNTGDGWLGTECCIDGRKIENVRAVDFQFAVNEAPTFVFETYGIPDIDMNGDLRFKFSPKTVENACTVLRHELMTDKDLYEAFLSSIESALKEVPAGMGMYDVSRKILDRIIGRE